MVEMTNPFEGVLGNSSELRMLELLLPMHGVEFNVSELAEEVKVSRVTVTKVVKKFVEWDMLRTRRISNVTLYSINENSPIVKSIVQFNNRLIEHMLGEETLFEIGDYLAHRVQNIPAHEPQIMNENIWAIESFISEESLISYIAGAGI